MNILKFTTKNIKSRQKLIYDKTAYVQSKIFTPVKKKITQPLVAMVMIFSMSGNIVQSLAMQQLQLSIMLYILIPV